MQDYICKKLKLVKNILIDLFQKINIAILQELLEDIGHLKSSVNYKNEKKVSFN